MAPQAPSPKISRLLTPSEAAAFLSISPRTLTRLTSAGELGHVRVGGQRRYELTMLIAYVTRQSRGA